MADDVLVKTPTDSVDAESLTATEGLVQRLSSQLDELKVKQKELSEMLKGIFDNDEEFTTAQSEAKEVSKKLKDRLSALNGSQEVQTLRGKITELREDLKMVQDSLNTHLVNYFQMTGTQSFPTVEGGEREFQLVAKLRPPAKKG
jgi:predicted  nucleic acid-binding Zn-ribbon protein